jgi:hypothetical protein
MATGEGSPVRLSSAQDAQDTRAITADAGVPAVAHVPAIWPKANRAAVAGLAALFGAAGFVVARLQLWAHWHISAFIMAGRHFTNPGQLPRGVGLRPGYGYDGQFFYRRARPAAVDLTWLVPMAVFAGWQLVVRAATGELPLLADRDRNIGTPFTATIRAVLYNFSHITTAYVGHLDVWLLELTALAAVAAAALASLRATATPAHERLAFVVYLAGACFLTPTIWSGYAGFRSFAEVYLLATIILMARPPRCRRIAAPAQFTAVTVPGRGR